MRRLVNRAMRALAYVTMIGCMGLAGVAPAAATSCKTQAAMSEQERGALVQAARQMATEVQAGRTTDLKAATIPEVAANFQPIQQSAAALMPLITGATITVNALYQLDASDAKPGEDQTQFFCDSGDASSHVTFSIPHLPPGLFAFALMHATGVAKPQQLALLLQQQAAGSPWQLAGFFPKPLTVAGHDGLWYWKQARTYTQKKQPWNAWFYYASAFYLLEPAGFFSSSNLEKLVDEQQAAHPADLPGKTPLSLPVNGSSQAITALKTDDALGGLDLVLHYDAAATADPVAARALAVATMKALLALHPELREGFHGMWAFADPAGGGQPFSLELPMQEISTP